MTRKETKELLPIMEAFAKGKEIEYSYDGKTWIKARFPTWNPNLIYRIKPEPKYRPFKSREECWKEMQKHQPFGWTKLIGETVYSLIVDVDNEIIYSDAFKECTFADGTPFGIKEN